MHFGGEPEIAVLRQESFDSSSSSGSSLVVASNSPPVMCVDQLWAVASKPGSAGGDFCLAVESAGEEGSDPKQKSLREVISFPPSDSSSLPASSERFTIIPRKCQQMRGEPKNLCIALRHSDGIFLVADCDAARGVGTGSLQLTRPAKGIPAAQHLVHAVIADDRAPNTVLIFATTDIHGGASGRDSPTTAAAVAAADAAPAGEASLAVMQIVVGTDFETGGPELQVLLSATIPQALAVTAVCPATDDTLAVALVQQSPKSTSSVVVELWSRAVLFPQRSQEQQQQSSNNSNSNSGELVLSACSLPLDKVGAIQSMCRDDAMRDRLFACTDRGNCIVYELSLKNSTSGGAASDVSPLLVIKTQTTLSVTSSSLTSVACACSTVWFADATGKVRIWSLETLEELGTLDSTTGSTTTGRKSPTREGGGGAGAGAGAGAIVLPMGELEFRHNLGVFRNGSLESLAVKQSVAGAVLQKPAVVVAAASPATEPAPAPAPTPAAAKSPAGKQQQQQSSSPKTPPPPAGKSSPKSPASSSPAGKKAAASSSVSPGSADANTAALSFIKQLCDVLARPSPASVDPKDSSSTTTSKGQQQKQQSQRVVVPDRVARHVAEAEYLEAAIQSVAQCSATIARSLPQLSLKPSSLARDVTTVCDMAVRLHRNEAKLRKVVESLEGQCGGGTSTAEDKENANSSNNSMIDQLVDICRRLAVKHDTETVKLSEKVEKGEEALRAAEDKHRAEAAELRAEVDALKAQLRQRDEADKAEQQRREREAAEEKRKYTDPNTGKPVDPKDQRIEQLGVELRSKAALVKHLMQLTNDNGRVIEEMRTHAVQRRDECVELRRAVRELGGHYAATVDGAVRDIDKMLATFADPHSTATSNLRSSIYMLQNLRNKLKPQ